MKPSSLTPTTVAHASSSISRRRVCSQLSPGSGRPAGRSQIVPSGLITTRSPSAVTHTPSAPCGVPSGGSGGGCHDTSHCWPPDRIGIGTPSAAAGPSATTLNLALRSRQSEGPVSSPRKRGVRLCPEVPGGNQVNGGRRPGYARPVAGQAELTSRQRRSLAEDGYLLVPAVLAADAVAALAGRLDELARAIIAEADAAVGGQWEEARRRPGAP